MSLIIRAFGILSLLCLTTVAVAQQESGSSEEESSRPSLLDELDKKEAIPDPTEKTPLELRSQRETPGEWVFAPVPGYNPSQEWSLSLMAQRIFSHKSDVKPSVLGGAVFATEKKSYGGLGGWLGRLDDDRLRINVFGGYAKVNSDFYGVGRNQGAKDVSVLLEQEYTFATVQVLPKWGPLYLGPTLGFSKVTNKFDIQGLPPTVSPLDKLEDTSWVPGLKFQMDDRDNTFYPEKGYLTSLTAQFFDENLGSATTFQRYRGNFNGYHQFTDQDVIAGRVAFQANVGDVPFYEMAVFGQGPDLRGFKAGKYRDKIMWATQAEYRRRLTDHWGVVAFGGFGDVVHSVSDLSLGDLLWAGGVGARYRIAVRNPVDFRVDVAYGDEWSWYFAVNQAF